MQGQTHGPSMLGVGDTRMLAELGLTPHPKMWAQPGVSWMGAHRGSSLPRHRHWVCPVPAGVPGHPHSPAGHGWCGSSCARDPAPARWGLLAARTAPCWGWGTPCTSAPLLGPGPRGARAAPPARPPRPALTGGRLTSQYACSWQSMTMRSPLRRCLAALAVQRQRGGAAGTLPARHPGCSIPAAPRAQRGRPCPHSPELLPRLHHHEVPRVVDPLVQEVVVVLGSDRQARCGPVPWPGSSPGTAVSPSRSE